MDEKNRERLVAWDDPMITAQAAQTMHGMDLLQKMVRGELPAPPIARLVNMTLHAVGEGTAEFRLHTGEFHYNPIGSVHGGIIATLIDSATGCAIHTTLPAGKMYTTLDLKLNYVRPVLAHTGLLRCIGAVIHPGRRVATAEARLIDESDKLYAHGTATCLIFEA